jgi:type I restriction enzyme S subunit
MEVKRGYKQTELGIIPEDWEVNKLDDCLDLLTDFEANGSFEDLAKKVRVYDKENYAWYVRATDLENNSKINELKFVDYKTYKFLRKTSLTGGEVLITKRGEIGKVYFFKMKTENATLAPNMYLLKFNSKVIPFYIYSYFKSELGNKLLLGRNESTTLGAIYKDDVKSITILLPPLPEQTAIANALSDIDALIESLEKLITKKCNIKQGAMQQLLTGKKRLPGFKSEWKTTKLSDLGFFRSGNGFPLKFQGFFDGKYPFFKVSDMNIKENKIYLVKANNLIDEDIKNTIYAYVFPRNTIVFAKIGAAIFLERKKMLFKNSCIDNNMMGFVYNENIVNSYYIYLVFHSIKLSKLISVTALPSLNAKDIGKIEFYIPPLPEQTAIAEVLSDMDSEIEALEKKLDKYKKVKQGMMQELLTGKKRLI